ncbi:SpoIIE family protein phosphatase [Streptomyces sp. NPDC006552]|uniref:PP2C family protein-serine/threonine phosphatase n=1 Tax=Streptomyces sp. NPDC006552 TaxID=3157179 RepID=UPI0033A41609
MSRTGSGPEETGGGTAAAASFAELLEDSPEDLYDHAPCGYLSTLMDGTIVKLNDTLLDWLGLDRDAVVGQVRFADLLPVGGRLYHETHFAPLLRMRGEISGVALELKQADGDRLPVLVSGVVKYGSTGTPLLTRITVFDATDRRAYETELLRSRKAAEESARQARADRARLQQALAVLQQSLLPASLPEIPGMEAAGYYHTASPDRLGGDFYDVFPLDGRRFGFFLGDVCGKGPEAAAVTSLTRYTLRAAALHDADPVAALTTLNQVLHDRYSSVDPRFCTAIFGVLDPDPRTGHVAVRLASGGHPPALVLRGAGGAGFLHTPGGLLVGALPDPRFTTATTTLAPGDTLLLYTDGVTEARTGPDRSTLFGDRALRDFAAEHAGPAEALIAALSGLLSGLGAGLDDDTALLALGVPASAPVPAPAPTAKNTP